MEYNRPLSNTFIFIDIGDTAEEGGILSIAQISHAVGFHAWNENEIIGPHDFFFHLFICFDDYRT